MTQTAQIVITGYVGTMPKQWNTSSQNSACSFRVGSTRRYFSVKENQWKSNETTWIQVKAFRSLADHALQSLKVGDAVIVQGTLNIDTWEKDGLSHSMPCIEATAIGHDLNLGTTAFVKDEASSHRSGVSTVTEEENKSENTAKVNPSISSEQRSANISKSDDEFIAVE